MNTIINNNASVSLSSTNAIINNSGSINLNSSNIALASLSCASLVVGGVDLQNSVYAMVSTETSRAIGVENSITSVINNITGVTLSNEISRAVLADLSLSSSIVSALSVDAVLSSSIVTALANDAFLTSSLSLETSRAINVENSLALLIGSSGSSSSNSSETSRAISVENYLESLIRSERITFTSILSSNNQGTYTVSASSVLPGYPGYKAFNGIKNRSDAIDFGWHNSSESYAKESGICTSFSTTYLTLNNVNTTANGEWVQIRDTNTFPLISGVKLYQNDTINGITSRTIENILIVGSNNGTTFEEIYSSAVTFFTSAEYNLATILFTSTKTYSYLRLIVTKIRGGGSTNDYIAIGEIEYLSGWNNNITTLQSSLSLEIITARSVETSLSSSIVSNVSNVATLSNSIVSNVATLSNSLSSEIIRAKSVESVLSNSIKFSPFIISKNFVTITTVSSNIYFNNSLFSNMTSANPSRILIKLVGGGGGGGGSSGNNPGGGGGAGAYYEGIFNLSYINPGDTFVNVGAGGASGYGGGATLINGNENNYIAAGTGSTGLTSAGAGLGGGGAGGVISSTDTNNIYKTDIVSSPGESGKNSTCVYIAGTQYGGAGTGGTGYFGTIGKGGNGGGGSGNNGIAIFMW